MGAALHRKKLLINGNLKKSERFATMGVAWRLLVTKVRTGGTSASERFPWK